MAIVIKNETWQKTLASAKGVRLFFLDPPFNLGKNYGPGISDRLTEDQYRYFVRALGMATFQASAQNSFCAVNIPPQHLLLYLSEFSLAGWQLHDLVARVARVPWPPTNNLQPAWVPLLVFSRGDPATNNGKRAIKTCFSCKGPVSEYKGSPPQEVWIDSMWDDIRQVTGKKTREVNELPLAFLCRIVSMYSSPGELICDPFVGSGVSGLASFFLGRSFCGGDINYEWVELSRDRVRKMGKNDKIRFLRWRDLK